MDLVKTCNASPRDWINNYVCRWLFSRYGDYAFRLVCDDFNEAE